MTDERQLNTGVCVVGGGPAGMMLGVLLARAGIDTTVLEKYPDFFRDFRGDTIHPSTLQMMDELGWLDDFLKLPHDELRVASASLLGQTFPIGDFTHLPTRCKFIAFTPQWDFLNFLAARGSAYPTFHLLKKTEGTATIMEEGRVVGVRATDASGPLAIRAGLVVGTDGRHSTMRACGGFAVEDMGAPMDVLWMRLPRKASDPERALGTIGRSSMLVMIDRHEYWQCAYIIPKGSFAALKAQGIEQLHKELIAIVPELADRVAAIDDWSKVSYLEVKVDRIGTWHRPGLLCIGDAAHAMSPVGGVGVNLAVQDAVATANILAAPLLEGRAIDDALLGRVQARRTFPMKATQRMQILVQKRLIAPLLRGSGPTRVPWMFRAIACCAPLRHLAGRTIGLGFRPEHVRTPDAFAQVRSAAK